MPHRFGRVSLAAEVNSFQREIGRDQRIILPALTRPQHSAVIADSGNNRRILAALRHLANAGNDCFLGSNHGH